MSFALGATSLSRLTGVHPDLIKVVKRAIQLTKVDFQVFCGVRTVAEQKVNMAKGVSKTMRSRHIPESNACKLGCAVDLVPLKDGKLTWANEDIPTLYKAVKEAVLAAAKELKVSVDAGADWKTFKDYPHYELSRTVYPFAK